MKRKLRNKRRNAKNKELTFNDVLSLGEFHYTENSKEALDFRAKVLQMLFARAEKVSIDSFEGALTIQNAVGTYYRDAFKYANLDIYGSPDYYEFLEILPGISETTFAIFNSLLWSYIITSSLELWEYKSVDEIPPQVIDELCDEINSNLSSPSYNGDESWLHEEEVDVETLLRVLRACVQASMGNTKEALNEYHLCEFCDSIASLYNDYISAEFVLKHMNIFSFMFFANENTPLTLHVVASEEIAKYNKDYRNNLPKELRDEVDSLIDVFKRPFRAALNADTCFYDGEDFSTIIMLVRDNDCGDIDASYTEDDIKATFVPVLKRLNDILPKLREQYAVGSAEKALPSFFCAYF